MFVVSHKSINNLLKKMKRKIIVGNWKMNPTSIDEAKKITSSINKISDKLKNTNIVICPPFIYIPKLISSKNANNVSYGVQNTFFEERGSFTGEISPVMLKEFGIKYSIIGHSERREMGETDEIIAKKVAMNLEIGIHPILCIGEKERDSQGAYLDILKSQIKNSLDKIPKKLISELIIAYEPVWAIGAKEPMTTGVINEMVIFIKKVISDMYGQENGKNMPILYGGSVSFRNALDIMENGGVNGLLVGRESVNPQGFVELLKVVDSVK
jgi:triosephosphate isomerase